MGSLFCKENNNLVPSCDFCNNLPDNDVYVAQIYHKGKYNGIYICKICLENKWKKPLRPR